jgi:diguanylate cyclase (GGDEF)-like protein/PAS domain S-box-containing protein
MVPLLAFLSIEDNPADFLLVQRVCRQDGMSVDWSRVDTFEALRDALGQREWDLVISDYHVPELDFSDSFSLIKSLRPDLPVILVSGHVGEERAVELMKLGVRDFLLKDNLKRLTPVITNVLREAQEIKARREAVAQLERERLRLQTILKTASDGIHIVAGDGLLVEANDAFFEIVGYGPEVLGQLRISDWHAWEPADLVNARVRDLIERRGKAVFETSYRRGNGTVVAVEVSASGIEIDGQGFLYGSTRDITERKERESRIRELAFYDPLTRLPNRRLLMDRLGQALAQSTRTGREGALLFVDLDNFKTVNDTLGHDKGDILLQDVARRLATSFREADTVARIGGDEFVVVLSDLSDNAKEAATHVEIVGAKILSVLGEPYEIAGKEFRSTPSIGVTLFGDQRDNQDELMKQADIAMYQAKAAGRNTLRFFDPELQATIKARAALEEDLHQGLREQQLILYFQPQLEDQRIIGAETLLRWRHPSRGLVSPAEFIPLAEETGLILEIGRWVFETACRQVVRWASHSPSRDLTVAVNVSPRQFSHPDFVQQILDILARTGADPGRLEMELTESMLVDNLDEVIAKMSALRSHGLKFALDDFGTGFSSLAYLKRLPLSKLKIDQAFVRDIAIDPSDATIVHTIITMGRTLGLEVIAEGVETAAQLEQLRSYGCTAYQGYLFSRPLPLPDFEAMLFHLQAERDYSAVTNQGKGI